MQPELNASRRRFLSFAVSGLTVVSLVSVTVVAGCGGGGSGSGTTRSATAPTATTRSRVQSLHGTAARLLTQVGFQNMTMAYSINGGGYATGGGAGAPVPAAGGAAGNASTVPLLGAFLRNVAAVPPASRATALAHAHRGEPTPVPPTPPGGTTEPGSPGLLPTPTPLPIETPTFYYDYYLGLWVEITDTTGKSTYSLYEDEAKTKPAGSIVTTQPMDWNTYPQVFASTYSFTSGYLAGSHGSTTNTTNADGSGTATYDNTYVDGWKDSGASSWSGRGDFSYQGRTDTPTGQWTQARGAFRSDGSSGSHLSTSDGYTADYVYNADGSGHGTITGPDPGLPVTLSWDIYGNTTIRYADGSEETIPGWGYGGGGGVGTPVPVDGGVSTTAPNSGSSSGK